MRQSKPTTPEPLHARRIHVEFTDDIPANWANGDPVVSCFFAALSTIFPDGERFFIHSVRHYVDTLENGDLKDAVKGFIAQEASHGRVHQAYNAWLGRKGYPVAEYVTMTKHALLHFKKAPPLLQVAFTTAFEHFTAILGEFMFDEAAAVRADVDQWHPTMRKVWQWHGMEENEHKSLAFDVFQEAGGGYLLRVSSLLAVSFYVGTYLSWLTVRYLHAEGSLKPSVLFKGLKSLWVQPGMFRRTLVPWFSFFKPGFHPWQRDNAKQLEAIQALLEKEGLFTAPAAAARAA